jgi:hypothetical protein
MVITLSGGHTRFNYEFNLLYSEYLKSLAIPHELMIIEGVDHSATRSYDKKGDQLMQFHQRHFAPPPTE